jgi:hypothetical protein
MDFKTAIKKPFTDATGLIVGIALSILPIVNWFSLGYLMESAGVKQKSTTELHAWTGWGSLFFKGFIATVITLVYLIPAILILVIGTAFVFLNALKAVFASSVPLDAIIRHVAAGKANEETFAAVLQANWPKILPILLSLAPVILVALLVGLLAWYLIPAAILNYAAHESFGEAFRLGKVFRVAFSGDYFAAWLTAAVLGGLVRAILFWIPLVGGGAGYFIAGVFSFHILGEAYRKAKV